MIEKSVILKGIPLVDFLGVENTNIDKLGAIFPKSKIISRGDKIMIRGDADDVVRITGTLNALIRHFHRFGQITEDHVKQYITQDNQEEELEQEQQELLLHGHRGVPIRIRTKNQQKLVHAVKENDLVFVLGPAGTGKTYVSVALAIKALKEKRVKKIIITRPVVEAGENLGFLPGDIRAKTDPYLRPIYDVLRDLISIEKMEYYMEREIIEIAPLAYMRGRTLHNAFMLLDEAQNTTPMQMRMALTRMGPESKMIVTGDPSQVDLPVNQCSGLVDAVKTLQDIEKIEFVKLTDYDVIRHRLVKDIIRAYQDNTPKGRTG